MAMETQIDITYILTDITHLLGNILEIQFKFYRE